VQNGIGCLAIRQSPLSAAKARHGGILKTTVRALCLVSLVHALLVITVCRWKVCKQCGGSVWCQGQWYSCTPSGAVHNADGLVTPQYLVRCHTHTCPQALRCHPPPPVLPLSPAVLLGLLGPALTWGHSICKPRTWGDTMGPLRTWGKCIHKQRAWGHTMGPVRAWGNSIC
jgi:hypothetical protein